MPGLYGGEPKNQVISKSWGDHPSSRPHSSPSKRPNRDNANIRSQKPRNLGGNLADFFVFVFRGKSQGDFLLALNLLLGDGILKISCGELTPK